ncbi:MAG TPA: chromate transporter [Candidatus Acetothermia bacterium]|nr:chromate transporter [Candidatus Acetothermia bacterium]
MPERGAQRIERVTLWRIFFVFFKIGLFTFGGGFAMLPVLNYELYAKRKWIDKEALTDIVSLSTVFPGAIAVNSAFLQGLRMRGAPGVIAAIIGIITPSIIVILLIGIFLFRFTSMHIVQAFFKGAGAAITGQIAYAVYVFGRGTTLNLRTVGLTLAILVVLFAFKVHPIVAILISGAVGVFIFPKGKA